MKLKQLFFIILGTVIVEVLQMAIWLSPIVLLISTSWFFIPPEFMPQMSIGFILYFLFSFYPFSFIPPYFPKYSLTLPLFAYYYQTVFPITALIVANPLPGTTLPITPAMPLKLTA